MSGWRRLLSNMKLIRCCCARLPRSRSIWLVKLASVALECTRSLSVEPMCAVSKLRPHRIYRHRQTHDRVRAVLTDSGAQVLSHAQIASDELWLHVMWGKCGRGRSEVTHTNSLWSWTAHPDMMRRMIVVPRTHFGEETQLVFSSCAM